MPEDLPKFKVTVVFPYVFPRPESEWQHDLKSTVEDILGDRIYDALGNIALDPEFTITAERVQ